MNGIKKIFGNANTKAVSLSSLEFSFWITFAAYYPLLVVFLRSKGYSNTTIGTIVAANSFITIFAQPFWGMISDKLRSIRKVFIFGLSAAIILLQPLPIIESATITGIILAIVTFFESPLNPLLDSWIIEGIRSETNIAYGQIRLWGSIGFAIFVYIYGKIADMYSTNYLFMIFGVMGLLTIFLSTRIKVDKPVLPSKIKSLNFGRLFTSYPYISFVAFAAILFIPHRGAFIFLPNLMESVSGSKTILGLSFSIMALSEVPIFLFSRMLLKKFKPIHFILVSTIFFILRQFLYPLVTLPFHVILIQALQGPSFALFLTGAVYYIDSIAPDELKSTAQTLATSMFIGFSGIIGSYGGGWVIDHFGLNSLYHIGIWVSIAVTLLFLASLQIGKLHVQTHAAQKTETGS
jgi:PPP family 3-phenylpropionic acid transporter